jgi:hypothetical protein
VTALDDAMNGRLSQILQMGSNANSYAAQAASKQQNYDNQQQQIAYQKQMQTAMAKMQAEQQAALKKQQSGYQSQLQSIMSRLGSSVQSNPTSGSPINGSYNAPSASGGKGNTFQNFLAAISGQESGGNYHAVNGSSGAMGKYQIMPGNIPSWSKSALGHSISAQQFLNSPQLQEQIAQYELGNYYKKYGPGGAAVAWYAGEGTAQKYVRNNGSGFNAPQGGYPSINQYALSVLKRMGLR